MTLSVPSRFKHFLVERNEFSKDGTETLLSVSEYYGVKPRAEAFNEDRQESRAESLEGYRVVRKGDLVMNYMLAWKGAYGVSEHDGIVSPAYSVFKVDANAIDLRYLHHRTRSKDMQAIFKQNSRGIMESRLRLYPENLLSLRLPLPPVAEQSAIARFLDRETARIDSLIEKKGRFIELLKEKRAAVITQAVTKGLDSTAPMRDSGIDWIGKIPVTWRMTRLGYLGRSANGINISGEAFGKGTPFVSYGDVYKNRQLPTGVEGLVEASSADQIIYSVKVGDIFFTRTSETVEEIAFSSVCLSTIEGAVFAGFLIRFRPYSGKLLPIFSKYAFQNRGFRDYFAKEMKLVTRASLSQGLLQGLPIPLPPLDEQGKIAAHLELQCEKIDTLIAKTERSIELLREKRSALITAAVTGNIDVRAAV